jgi:hypothetical protein
VPDLEVLELHSAALLARHGVLPDTDDPVAVTPEGAVLYVSHRTIVARPGGRRPAGVRPLHQSFGRFGS